MNTPVSELDTRFSDPSATATTWEQSLQAIQRAELFWICTVRASGRPHLSPVVAVWLDGAIHFSTGPGEQKAINLQHNAHVLILTGCNGWEEGLDVVVEGDAVQVTDQQTLEHLAAVWTTKWDGRWRYKASNGRFRHAAGEALVFAVRPSKVLAFGKGPFRHTRHRF